MKKAAFACALLVLGSFGAEAFAVDLYNRSGGTLCAAETRDEADPFDENVGRNTEGWKCFEDLGTLRIEPSDGMLDIAIKRADGTDYVAGNTSLKIPKVTSYVPEDEATEVFGVYILKHSTGWVAYSWKNGSDGEWSAFQTVPSVDELPAKLAALGLKPLAAWQFDFQHSGLGYTLN